MKKNDFQPAIRITWGVIGLCCVALLLMFKIYLLDNDSSGNWFFLVFSIPLLIFSLIFIAILSNAKKVYSQEQWAIQHGEFLAHWLYEEDEWNRFNITEWKKTWKRAILIPIGCIGIFFLIGWLDTEFSTDEIAVATPWVIGFFASLSFLLLFYSYLLYKRTKTCQREVFIGPHGLLYGGYYNTWEAIGTRLGGVKLIPGAIPVLEFDIRVWGRYGSNSRPLRIPVPKDRDKEAEEVIAKLKV